MFTLKGAVSKIKTILWQTLQKVRDKAIIISILISLKSTQNLEKFHKARSKLVALG